MKLSLSNLSDEYKCNSTCALYDRSMLKVETDRSLRTFGLYS